MNKVPRELEFAVKILVVISTNNNTRVFQYHHWILPENIAIVKSGRRLAKYSHNII
jgi:hypothetical protein